MWTTSDPRSPTEAKMKAKSRSLSAGVLAALLGLLCADGLVAAARTADRPFAVAWNRLFHVEEALHFVHFRDARTGWAVGENGVILATRDGGKHWQQIQTRATDSSLWGVQFAGAHTGWAVGRDGTVLVTSDDGETWRVQNSRTKQNLTSVYFVDARRGWAVGENGLILATADGGERWQTQISHTRKILWRVHLTSPDIRW